ncbi:proton-conducting transporter membrane subunit [Streptomyces sp. 35G-GA-8]|uniref:NADH-quinone oxidoreductase subunit 5 family protein n=1 Tax=Streptomyces sp. 35G-GA-8 TaxID=2939434 RepID=UPI00201EC512|nr:proton-conducting transporter membrane subunit [Streptomyces sp. 35G-GA-8]MCL7377938.1 NADH-quinone oxidoreductase subunit L [Streptomyces sp. 35G-GA-8]
MSALLWALLALPLTTGTVLAAGGRGTDRAAPVAAVATALVTLGLAIAVAVGRPTAGAPLLDGLPVRLVVDGLSGVMTVTVAAITTAVLVFSVGDVPPGAARARFFGLMLLFSGAMLATVTAATLPVLLMAWELMGATSWALIGFWWRDPENGRAANIAFLTTRAADLGLYLAAGAALAAGGAGSLALADLPGATGPWLAVITAGVIVAALGKSAQLPFSFWLSHAIRGPSPVSALLHSATMVVAGAYLLIRLEPLLAASGWGGTSVAWAGAVTAVLLGLVAVAQNDLKQLLAASSCAQIGFMVLAAGVGSATGATLQLMAHAAAKSLAFLVAGCWLAALGARTLPALRGAARRDRTAGIAFTVAALTLAGVPPLSLWAAKDVLLAAVLHESAALYGVGLAGAVVSAVYAAKALWFVWGPRPCLTNPAWLATPGTRARRVVGLVQVAPLRERPSALRSRSASEGGVRAPRRRERSERSAPDAASPALRADDAICQTGPSDAPEVTLPRVTRPPLVGLAVACAGLTVLAFPPGREALGRVLGAPAEPAPPVWEFLLSGGLALVASAAVWVRGPRAPGSRWWADWLGLEAAARLLLGRPVVRLAHALAAFDDHVLDRAVDGGARAVLRLARWTDRRVEGRVDGGVEGVAAGARALGRWARLPQTGQLHQYLAQAVVAFTVLAVVLVLMR